MADYQCWPLWHHKGEQVGDIDPNEIGVSAQLAEDLENWADVFESHMNWSDPAATKWTEEEEGQFASEGRALCRRLAQELNGRYTVYYHVPFTSQVIPAETLK